MWLSGIFGKDPRTNRQFVDSLAAGLKSVGTNWNKPGLAAFAASAGAALEGGSKADEKFFEETRKAKEEVLKYEMEGDKKKLNEALAKLREIQAKAIEKHGTISSRANDWRNSEVGQISMADQQLAREAENIRKQYRYELERDPDQDVRNDARKKVEDAINKRREEIYRERGIDPNKADQIKLRGQPVTDSDGKIDLEKTKSQAHRPMSEHEFHSTVPVGQFYINPSDGKLYRRKSEAPPPVDAPNGALSQQQSSGLPDLSEGAEPA